MNKEERRVALAAYKKREVAAGIYAVRCGPTGACWAGRSPDLSAVQKRLWFSLRQGDARYGPLVAAWKEHGEEAFAFEVVEQLDPDEAKSSRDALLKGRLAHWMDALGARPLV